MSTVRAEEVGHFGRPIGERRESRIADIGCGAGLMCEPLAARDALVDGVGADVVFRVLPRGTHRWAQLVRSEDLERAAGACGLARGQRRGIACGPGVHRVWWTHDRSVYDIASFGKPFE